MALFDLFVSSEKKKGKSHLKNLMAMAMADGKLEDSEYKFLLKIAEKYSISINEVDKMKSMIASKGDFEFEKGSTKFEQIYDLVKMMMIDNNINANELKMCKNFAKKIGYAVNKVDELIESVVQNISIGHTLEETQLRVSYLIKE